MYAVCANVLGAPAPNLVHVATDFLARAVPRYGAIVEQNFPFNNLFDNAAAQNDLAFGYSVNYAAGARRVLGYLAGNDKIKNSDDPARAWYDRLFAAWKHHSDEAADQVSQIIHA